MIKFVITSFVIIFLSACGVDTSSSSKEMAAEQLTDSDLIVSNPIDPNPVGEVMSNNPTDSNDPANPDEPIAPVITGKTNFDTLGAIEDPNACRSDYLITRDASYGGDIDGENGASVSVADGQGLTIRSDNLTQDFESTWVMLYNKNFPTGKDLNQQGYSSYTMEDVFTLAYDLAWADKSIPNIDNIVYVQSNKTAKPSCYRLTLNSINSEDIDVQKVYRLEL